MARYICSAVNSGAFHKERTCHAKNIIKMISHSEAQRLYTNAKLISTDYFWSRGSSGSIVTDYGLDDWGSIPDRGRGFFF
jgi:hypothetical protein